MKKKDILMAYLTTPQEGIIRRLHRRRLYMVPARMTSGKRLVLLTHFYRHGIRCLPLTDWPVPFTIHYMKIPHNLQEIPREDLPLYINKANKNLIKLLKEPWYCQAALDGISQKHPERT